MEIRTHAEGGGLGRPHDAAVVIATLLRPTLLETVRSVYAQDLGGRIHLLIGIDVRRGPDALLDQILAERPAHISVTVCDPGYSTCTRNGGLCQSYSGGELRTVLTYLAHSRYVAYLDDDNWWAPDHLSSLRHAIDGGGWAFALRWFVDAATGERLMLDTWEAPGHDPSLPPAMRHGYADTNGTMIDKLRCHAGVAEWSYPNVPTGEAADRVLWRWLHAHQPGRGTGRGTVYYRVEDRHQLADRLKRRMPRATLRRRPLAELMAVVAGETREGSAVDDAPHADDRLAAVLRSVPDLGSIGEALLVGGAAGDAIALARAAPSATVVALDDWRSVTPVAGSGPPPAYSAFRAAIAGAGLAGRVRPLPMRAIVGAGFLQRVGVAVDLVLLDLERGSDGIPPDRLLLGFAGILRPRGAMLVRGLRPASTAVIRSFAASWELAVPPPIEGGFHLLRVAGI